MDINNLEAFIEVADSKSFSRSAEALRLTQPAVSKRIAALETELTLRLFDRVGRSVHLTEAGKMLLPAARKITTEVSRVSCEIISMGKEVGGTFSIGAIEHAGLERLAPLLKRYKQKHPKVEIDVHVVQADEGLHDIESGKVEMILCSTNTPVTAAKSQSHLIALEVFSERQLVVVANDHALVRLNTIDAVQLTEHPAILPQPRSATRQSIDKVMAINGVAARIAMQVRDTSTARAMVASGMGWALLPESELTDNLAVLNVPDLQLTYSQHLVRHSQYSTSRAAQAFIDMLQNKEATEC